MSPVLRSVFTMASVLALAACSSEAPEAQATQDATAAANTAKASPVEVVQKHVDAMKTGDMTAIMSDYAEDTVVIAPEGLVEDQAPATGGGVFSGADEARRVFATLTGPGSLEGIKAMETRIEPLGDDVALLYWTMNKGQPNEASGRDVFVVRDGKIVFQDIVPDA